MQCATVPQNKMNHEKNPFNFYFFKISVKSILDNSFSRDFTTTVIETAELEKEQTDMQNLILLL